VGSMKTINGIKIYLKFIIYLQFIYIYIYIYICIYIFIHTYVMIGVGQNFGFRSFLDYRIVAK
jgi:hypothetical protein